MATDEVLMLQFQAGSRESFEDLFSRYRDPVYAFFRRRSGCRESAEDLAQELWVAVMKGAVKYQPRAPFRAYVFGLAFKLLAGERRKNAKQNLIRVSDAPVAASETAAVEQWTKEALGKLEATDREIIMLREYEQLSYEEIAHLLHIPLKYGPLAPVSGSHGAETSAGARHREQSCEGEILMATAIHAFSPEEIMAYLDGELAAQRALAVAQHLEECGECKSLVLELQGLSQELGKWEVGASSGILPIAPPEMEPSTIALWRRPWLVTCAAGLAILCVATMTRFVRKDAVESDVPRLEQYARLMRAPESNSRARAIIGGSAHALAGIGGNTPVPAAAGPLVVKTGRLSLTSNNFDGIRSSVERITVAYQGYIGQLELNTRAGASRSITASLRVPASRLDSVIEELKKLGRVDSESQTGDDVTQRSVNLDARLENLRTTETRLQEILKNRTGKLADVLEVEEAVDRTRGEIEQAEAERKLLSSQISFATLQLNVSEEYKAPIEGRSSVFTTLRNAAVEGYRNAVDSVIGVLTFLLSTGPTLLIVVAIGFFPALWLWRWWRQHQSLY